MIVLNLNKSEFKKLLSLATKESYFIFNDFLYKQIHGVAMSSPLGPTENKYLEKGPEEFKPVYYREFVYDIFSLFSSRDHLIKFRNYLYKCHSNMNFLLKKKKMESCLSKCRSVSRRKQVCYYCPS